jgi:hypothetical protein
MERKSIQYSLAEMIRASDRLLCKKIKIDLILLYHLRLRLINSLLYFRFPLQTLYFSSLYVHDAQPIPSLFHRRENVRFSKHIMSTDTSLQAVIPRPLIAGLLYLENIFFATLLHKRLLRQRTKRITNERTSNNLRISRWVQVSRSR